MKRLLVLALLVLVPAPASLADGCPLPCSGQTASPPYSKLLYVQPGGVRGELIAYSTATRQAVFSLPPGMASADGRTYYTSYHARKATGLRRFHVPTARHVDEWKLPGRWDLEGVSPTGRWAALTQRTRSHTWVLVVDGRSGKRAHVLRLRGNFEVETVSRDGKRMFLIEHLAGRSYNVREYDLSRERLVANPLRAQGVKIMAGYAWSGVASPDGHWLLTLYLSTPNGLAFVHALDLEESKPACISLPSGHGYLERLKRYSLTLAPSGNRLFAANPALGVVAEIDLTRSRVVRTTRFAPTSAGEGLRAATLSTMSRDGRTLYFSAGRDLWAFDAAYSVVRGPYSTGGKIVGVGYGAGDRKLFAVRKDGQMLTFEAATGKPMR
jgi:hypothetical protein